MSAFQALVDDLDKAQRTRNLYKSFSLSPPKDPFADLADMLDRHEAASRRETSSRRETMQKALTIARQANRQAQALLAKSQPMQQQVQAQARQQQAERLRQYYAQAQEEMAKSIGVLSSVEIGKMEVMLGNIGHALRQRGIL